MSIIVENLYKVYKRHRRNEGVKGFLEDLFRRKYEIVPALRDICFTVKRGEFVGYLGSNGAGKTTTMKLLSGILMPDKGKIRVMGEDPFRRKKRFLKNIGFIMGSKSQLWWDLPAMDTFRLMQSIYDINEKDFQGRIDTLSSVLAIKDLVQIPVRKLSLGERMKMEFICSLLHSPDILFLDEPTIGLDLVSQDSIRQFLRWYNIEYNATILLTSHYIRDIEELCARIIIIKLGSIIFDGTKDELHKSYSNFRIVTTDINDEYKSIGLADQVNIIGNQMRHLIHESKEKLLLAELAQLSCKEIDSIEINFEEALKVKMQDES